MRRALALFVSLSLLLSPALVVEAQSGPALMKLPGMKLGGTVKRDANGVPSIWAFGIWDLIFLQGYTHAQDRLFQMDYSRRQANGTLAELLGPAALPSDTQFRTIGLKRAADASWTAASTEVIEICTAYAAGVNAWVASNPLPAEYAALELTQFPAWQPVDALSVAKLIAAGLSLDLGDSSNTVALLTYDAVGKAAGFDGVKLFYDDLFRSAPFEKYQTLPPAAARQDGEQTTEAETSANPESLEALYAETRERVDEMQKAGMLEVLTSFNQQAMQVPMLRATLEGDREASSNDWVVAGRLSSTGNAMIANDPHLALDTPSTWYPISLRGADINVAGNSFPGTPLVVHGQNQWLAWGSTVNPMDVTDFYQESIVPNPVPGALAPFAYRFGGATLQLDLVSQSFRQNNPGNGVKDDLTVRAATDPCNPPALAIPAATLIVNRNGKNAPIISLSCTAGTAVTLQYSGLYATREFEAILKICRARSVDAFKTAIQSFDVGSQNWMVASTSGDIAWFTSAEMPIREDLQAAKVTGLPPWLLRSGAGGNDWIPQATRPADQAIPFQILPFSEMPQSVNPARGWLANGNNDAAGVTLLNNPLGRLRAGGGIYYLNPAYSGFRGARIANLIQQKLGPTNANKLSVADMKAIQADNVMIDALFFVPKIVEAFTNGRAAGANPTLAALASSPVVGALVQRLQAWDGSTPTGIRQGYDPGDDPKNLVEPTAAEVQKSVAASIYAAWRSKVLANTIDGVLGSFPVPGGAPRPGDALAVTALRNLFETFPQRAGRGASGVPFFNAGQARPEDNRDVIVLKSLADGFQMLASEAFAPAFAQSTNLDDYRWGKLHRKVFAHPLGGALSIPTAGGAFPAPLTGLPGLPRAGGFEVIDRSDSAPRASTVNGFMFGGGSSHRYVAEAAPGGIHGHDSLPGGVSGNVTSPLYFNLLLEWLVNRTYPVELQTTPSVPWR